MHGFGAWRIDFPTRLIAIYSYRVAMHESE